MYATEKIKILKEQPERSREMNDLLIASKVTLKLHTSDKVRIAIICVLL